MLNYILERGGLGKHFFFKVLFKRGKKGNKNIVPFVRLTRISKLVLNYKEYKIKN